MATGLKQELGLGEPKATVQKGSSEQADKFKAAFRTEKSKIDEALQFTAAYAEPQLHSPLATKRDKTCSAYQVALDKIDPAKPAVVQRTNDQVISAVKGVAKDAASLKQCVEKSYNAWTSRQSELNAAADQIREMVDWGHAKASPLQQVLDAITVKANSRKWDQALQGLEQLLQKLGPIFEDYSRQKAAQKEYDAALPDLEKKLAEASTCEFASLESLQLKIVSTQDEMRKAADCKDYVTALDRLKCLVQFVDDYLKQVGQLRAKKQEYETARAALNPRLTQASTSQCESLAELDLQIADLTKRMDEAAAAGDYEQALQIVTELSTKVDEKLKRVADIEAMKMAYEAARAPLDPRLALASTSRFELLAELDLQIADLTKQMDEAVAAKNYEKALQIVNELGVKVDEKLRREREIDQKKTEYESRLAALLQRYDALAQCKYPEVTPDQTTLIELRDKMEAAAKSGDYPQAVELMNQLEELIARVEKVTAELDAKRTEFEKRLPELVKRLDAAMQCDFKELEAPRQALEKGRKDMEAAAAGNDFRTALDLMNSLQQQLDTLDKRLAELIELKKKYEAAYAELKEGLATVERSSHEELAAKKSEIVKLRDEMTKAAGETDYGPALEKALALKPLVKSFLEQLEKREEYTRRLALVQPRVEAARKFKYKTLKDAIAEIDKLFGEMTAEAKKGEFVTALTKMGELETKLDEIEAANEKAKTDEIRYQERHDMLKPQVDAAEGNEAKEANEEAVAVGTVYEEMFGLAKEHKFAEAIEKSKTLADAIKAYEAKLHKLDAGKEKYDALAKLALARLKKATDDAKKYEKTLGDDLKSLNKLKESMESLADKEKKYEEAIAKIAELNSGLDDFEKKLNEVKEAEAAYKARAEKAIATFEGLPKEAKEKAEDAYKRAQEHISNMKSKAKDEDFEAALEEVNKLEAALKEIDEALKTGDELEAEYEGRRESLKPRLDKVTASPWAKKLETEKKAVDSAVAEMEKVAGRKDFKGALELADGVDKALNEFDKAEDVLEQKMIRFEERMDGFKKRFEQAKAITWPTHLLPRVFQLQTKWDIAYKEAKEGELDSALEKAASLRDEVDAIIAEADKLKSESKTSDDDDGILDRIKDFGEDVVDKVVDKAVDIVVDEVGGVVKDAKEVVDKISDGEIWDAAKEATDLLPQKRVVKKIRKVMDTVDLVEEVTDKVDKIKKIVTD